MSIQWGFMEAIDLSRQKLKDKETTKMSDTSQISAKRLNLIMDDKPIVSEIVQAGIWMPEQEVDRRITELEKRVAELEKLFNVREAEK